MKERVNSRNVFIKNGVFCLRLSCVSSFSTDMGFPSSKQCHEELFLTFVPLIIYIAYITVSQFSYAPHARTCLPRTHAFVLQGRRVIEEVTITDTTTPVLCTIISAFLLQLLVRLSAYHCPSALLFVAKIFYEDPIGHNLVSLERSGKTDHLPIPVLKIISTFNSTDVPDTKTTG